MRRRVRIVAARTPELGDPPRPLGVSAAALYAPRFLPHLTLICIDELPPRLWVVSAFY